MTGHREMYRSGRNEADSKSVVPLGTGGSNPSISARKARRLAGLSGGDGGIRIVIEHPSGVFICQCEHWQIPLFFAVSRKAKKADEYPPSFSPVLHSKKARRLAGLSGGLEGFES